MHPSHHQRDPVNIIYALTLMSLNISVVYPIELYDKLGEPVANIPKESANTLIRICTVSRTTCTSPMQKTSTSSGGASVTLPKWLRRLKDMSAEGEDRDGVE
ncbi:hypothetical protein FB451DRAFT_1190163 [Mycena latifolia]|nr:hypothetical protein FB451DRAFT_1190163 [Mycena latifolia]